MVGGQSVTRVDQQAEQALRAWSGPYGAELDVAGAAAGFGARADVTDGYCLQARTVVDQYGVPQPLRPYSLNLPAQIEPWVDSAG